MARERKFTKDELYETTRQLLLEHGYEGFTFTLLAKKLDLSRAAIYKYYDHKEELLSEYMLFELKTFQHQLEKISQKETFSEQFDALFDILFHDMSLYELRDIGLKIPALSKGVAAYKQKISDLHTKLYTSLEQFIQIGRREHQLREDIPSYMILGLIFQTVNIPNTEGIPHQDWVKKIKELICHGIYKKS